MQPADTVLTRMYNREWSANGWLPDGDDTGGPR